MASAGAGSDMSDDKEHRFQLWRRHGGAGFLQCIGSYWISPLPWDTGFHLHSEADLAAEQ